MKVSNREYRSDVFSMLMEYPEYAMDVYKALGGNSQCEPSMIEVKSLQKGISLSIRNDAAFIIDTDLHLYEHQSTYNPNMPLRSLLYLTDIIRPMLKNRDLYGWKLIQIPKPRFVVFYNGEANRPEVEIQKLSTAYSHAGDENGSIELICTVYNINPNKNDELKNQSYVLKGYMQFVEKVREYVGDEDVSDEAVVGKAVEYCIDNHILELFFKERKSEVIKIMTLDMTFEAREKIFRREEYDDGFEQGEARGKLQTVIGFVKKGICPIEVGASEAGMSVEEFKKVMDKEK